MLYFGVVVGVNPNGGVIPYPRQEIFVLDTVAVFEFLYILYRDRVVANEVQGACDIGVKRFVYPQDPFSWPVGRFRPRGAPPRLRLRQALPA